MPTRDDLARILDSSTGETSYARLLVALAAAKANAVLELRRAVLQKTIIFDAGAPVDCRSNIATEILGRYLVSTGKVKEADANAAFAVAAARGVPIGEILVERGHLTSTDLYRALQQNLGRKLLEPFSWTDGTYTLTENPLPLASSLRVKVPQLIVTGVQKVEPQENADEAAAQFEGQYVTLNDDPLFELDDVRLSAAQQKIVDAARKATKLDQLRGSEGIDTDEMNRTLYALTLLGIVEPSDRPRRAAPRTMAANPFAMADSEAAIEVPLASIESAPEVAPAPPPAPPPQPPPAHASADEVVAAYLSFRRKDSFDLLGVEETDGPVSINKVFLYKAERFHPARFPADAADSLRDKAQEVFLALARAYAELADPTRRETLIKRREKLREEAAAAAKAGSTAMIDPEALWKSGVNLAAAGKLREALGSFELAAQCDAQNGTYAAEVAWCRYRLGSTPAVNAIKLIKNAIRIDPNAGIPYLYAAELQAVLGMKVEALGYLQRASALLPNDPRPAEAAKRMK
jgi:tetratricopeptide (TPR) repeat protein